MRIYTQIWTSDFGTHLWMWVARGGMIASRMYTRLHTCIHTSVWPHACLQGPNSSEHACRESLNMHRLECSRGLTISTVTIFTITILALTDRWVECSRGQSYIGHKCMRHGCTRTGWSAVEESSNLWEGQQEGEKIRVQTRYSATPDIRTWLQEPQESCFGLNTHMRRAAGR